MVRAIVGTLVEVGRGKISAQEFKRILESKDRKEAGPTAPAHGLFLKEVKY
jgi:tRNA pseudouridine38-40 synthase